MLITLCIVNSNGICFPQVCLLWLKRHCMAVKFKLNGWCAQPVANTQILGILLMQMIVKMKHLILQLRTKLLGSMKCPLKFKVPMERRFAILPNMHSVALCLFWCILLSQFGTLFCLFALLACFSSVVPLPALFGSICLLHKLLHRDAPFLCVASWVKVLNWRFRCD